MIARGFRMAGFGGIAASCALVMTTSCTRVPLTAPTKSTIALYATAPSVGSNGSVDLIATVTEDAGTPVQNGTLVTFTTTLGHLQPTSARTTNGQAKVTLLSDGASGTATVSAFSGGATAVGSDGTSGSAAATLTIPFGGAAADTVIAHAEPGSVPRSGGTVQIIAQVRDASGNGLAGVPVTFTTTAGQLQSPSVISDASGTASTSFTTTSKATVTVHAGTKTADVVVDVAALPTLTITASPEAPVAGQVVTFTVTVDASSGLNPVRNVRIAFGDGDFQDLGVVTGSTTVSHKYGNDGSRTVVVTVTDTAGQQVSQSLVIVVGKKVPLGVTLTTTPTSAPVNTVVTFTASATAGSGVNIQSYDWNFGDGTTQTTTGGSLTKIYTAAGTYHATVTVHGSDGTTGVGAADVLITSS